MGVIYDPRAYRDACRERRKDLADQRDKCQNDKNQIVKQYEEQMLGYDKAIAEMDEAIKACEIQMQAEAVSC